MYGECQLYDYGDDKADDNHYDDEHGQGSLGRTKGLPYRRDDGQVEEASPTTTPVPYFFGCVGGTGL